MRCALSGCFGDSVSGESEDVHDYLIQEVTPVKRKILTVFHRSGTIGVYEDSSSAEFSSCSPPPRPDDACRRFARRLQRQEDETGAHRYRDEGALEAAGWKDDGEEARSEEGTDDQGSCQEIRSGSIQRDGLCKEEDFDEKPRKTEDVFHACHFCFQAGSLRGAL